MYIYQLSWKEITKRLQLNSLINCACPPFYPAVLCSTTVSNIFFCFSQFHLSSYFFLSHSAVHCPKASTLHCFTTLCPSASTFAISLPLPPLSLSTAAAVHRQPPFAADPRHRCTDQATIASLRIPTIPVFPNSPPLR